MLPPLDLVLALDTHGQGFCTFPAQEIFTRTRFLLQHDSRADLQDCVVADNLDTRRPSLPFLRYLSCECSCVLRLGSLTGKQCSPCPLVQNNTIRPLDLPRLSLVAYVRLEGLRSGRKRAIIVARGEFFTITSSPAHLVRLYKRLLLNIKVVVPQVS